MEKRLKQLLEMLQTLEEGIDLIGREGDPAMMRECIIAIRAIREVCQQSMLLKRRAVYVELFDGMTEALQQLPDHADRESLKQTADLCRELIEYARQAVQQENESKKTCIVFLPYKASMWDSLESIWEAADKDPECEAYVMPIPYYERNADFSLGTMHYEGELFPANVPIISYKDIDLGEWKPDIIYIHNPYDEANYVTSIDPAYYSAKLKQYTRLLMYIPYYATAGGMGEGQSMCPAYLHADYIVIQAEFLRRFFDPSVPARKLLALGSPKFDRVVHMCQDPPEPPSEWKGRMQGKKVYFYNTSLSGMLGNTQSFLQKMKYVFQLFQGREDACLLWRPHPLLETTFLSMRKEFYPAFLQLKQYFLENELGIYDETPDIDQTIAWCDVYIGDAGTSVTSLFGVAGKPLFILNNNIHELPQADDWRAEIIAPSLWMGNEDWMITANNKLYHTADQGRCYTYHSTLSEFASGGYYIKTIDIEGKTYICPGAARDILVVEGAGLYHIPLEPFEGHAGAFANAWAVGSYLFLIPFRYPAIVRYDTRSGKIAYIRGGNGFFVDNVDAEWLVAGSCIWEDKLVIGSPVTAQLLVFDIETLKSEIITVDEQSRGGSMVLCAHGAEIWMLPFRGAEIFCWNMRQRTVRKYTGLPGGLRCRHPYLGTDGDARPFLSAAFSDDGRQVVFSPCWANMFVCLDRETGGMKQWDVPLDTAPGQTDSYFFNDGIGGFVRKLAADTYLFYHIKSRRFYKLNLIRKTCQEISIGVTLDGIEQYSAGFAKLSEGLRYGCEEGAINSLQDLLDGTIHGTPFDRELQLAAYGEVAANHDGTSGEKIHQRAMLDLAIRG